MKFYLKESKSETSLIMLEIYDKQFVNGKFKYSTGERIESIGWDKKKGRAKKEWNDVNERLLEIEKAATSFMRINRGSLTSASLKEHLNGGKPKEEKVVLPDSMLTEYENFLVLKKGTVTRDTFRNYYNVFLSFKEFMDVKKFSKLLPGEFSDTHFQKFRIHLKKYPSSNTSAKHIKYFKQFVLSLVKTNPIGMEPDAIKSKQTSGLKISLEEEELTALYNYPFTGYLERVRDLFLLQCNTGLRISDLFRVSANLQKNKIVMSQQKTEKGVEIPLTPVSKEIVLKYEGKLPRMNKDDYRKGIKQIYRQVSPNKTIQKREGEGYKTIPVWEEISSHDAVRTFITISANRGMTIASIAKITGKSVKVLLTNYKVESQKIAEDEMKKIWG